MSQFNFKSFQVFKLKKEHNSVWERCPYPPPPLMNEKKTACQFVCLQNTTAVLIRYLSRIIICLQDDSIKHTSWTLLKRHSFGIKTEKIKIQSFDFSVSVSDRFSHSNPLSVFAISTIIQLNSYIFLSKCLSSFLR